MPAQALLRCFNRTFMELKSKNFMQQCIDVRSFNRTFMELKSETVKLMQTKVAVLIVPLWN